jgi:hypothetical protein
MAPVFFLPYLPHDLEEASYAHMAKKVGRPVPALGARAYSMSFEHDGVLWIATVGETLKGCAPILRNGEKTYSRQVMEDPALVLAIFPGVPYCVMTAGCSNMPSHFANSFYAEPKGIELFSWQHSVRARMRGAA